MSVQPSRPQIHPDHGPCTICTAGVNYGAQVDELPRIWEWRTLIQIVPRFSKNTAQNSLEYAISSEKFIDPPRWTHSSPTTTPSGSAFASRRTPGSSHMTTGRQKHVQASSHTRTVRGNTTQQKDGAASREPRHGRALRPPSKLVISADCV